MLQELQQAPCKPAQNFTHYAQQVVALMAQLLGTQLPSTAQV